MRIPVGSISVDLIERGDRICVHVAKGGSFEPETLAVWGRLCLAAAGRTVIDAGAYSGLFSIAAGLFGCRAEAFEPMPLNRERFLENANANGVGERLGLHAVALSDRAGSIGINYNPAVTGLTSGASIVNANLGRQSSRVLTVETRTLDSYGFENVAAIKIDVERAEPLVLLGARETLARCRPTLIVETLGDEERAAVVAAVTGYTVADVLDGRNWLMVPA